jgi:hypothetical protein
MGHDNGAGVCPTCGWHERHDTILDADAEKARGLVRFVFDENGAPIGLFSRVLPLDSEVPDVPLILDATATPDVVRDCSARNRSAGRRGSRDDHARHSGRERTVPQEYTSPGTRRTWNTFSK